MMLLLTANARGRSVSQCSFLYYMLTQEQLKKILDYNPSTGIFTWKEYEPHRAVKGKEAGTNRAGYRVIGVLGSVYYSHRLAWLYVHGEHPKYQIDHINRDRGDNRIKNLRDVSPSINTHNTSISKTNSSGYVGVSWDKTHQRWLAKIEINRKRIVLGRFKEKTLAIEARAKAEKDLGLLPRDLTERVNS